MTLQNSLSSYCFFDDIVWCMLYGVWWIVHGMGRSCGMPRCWVSYPQRNGNEPENHWPTRERQTMPIRSKPIPLQLATRWFGYTMHDRFQFGEFKTPGKLVFSQSTHNLQHDDRRRKVQWSQRGCRSSGFAEWRRSSGGPKGFQSECRIRIRIGIRWAVAMTLVGQTNKQAGEPKKKGGDIICVTRGVGFCVVFTPRQAFK